MLTVFFSYTYILQHRIVHWRTFHCLNFSYLFFQFGACKRNFNEYSAVKMDIRFYLLFFFIWSFVYIVFYYIHLCRETYTHTHTHTPDEKKIIYGCIWFTCSINSCPTAFSHSLCTADAFSILQCVPFGECFRSILFSLRFW